MSEQVLARGVSPALLLLLAGGVAGEWTGHLGLSFESDRKVEERTMLCPSGFITGLKVRQGRDERSDIDTYDFQLQCGRRWSAWTGMTFTGLRQEKAFECPMKMHMTGLEVTKGRREWGDVDTYDFKLQCSGVWQEYMGLGVSSAKERAAKECPSGTMAWGWKAFRGFVKRGDQDYYNFDLNCKPAADSQQAVRKTPSPREIGLSPNVFLWSAKDVGTWLGVLGLGDYSAAFEAQGTGWAGGWDGDGGEVRSLRPPRRRTSCRATSFSCCSSRTCRTSACARLYFMEELTQLHDSTNAWAKALGTPLSSTRRLPNPHKAGLPAEVVSWSVKEVVRWVEALGLHEWAPLFLSHRVQGDVMFSLTEVTLKEMGMGRIGDRLFTVDCLQSLYEELTSWKKRRETVQATVDPARLLGGGASAAPQGGVTSAGRGYATASPSGAGAGSAGSGGRGSAGAGASSVLQQLLAQGFSLQEVYALAKSRPDLAAKLGL